MASRALFVVSHAASLLILISPVAAQEKDAAATSALATTQRSRPTHAKLVEAASQRPLSTREFKKADGSPLSDAEMSEVRQAEEGLNRISELRMKGEYGEAQSQAEKSGRVLSRILGPLNYLNITASVQYTVLNRYLAAKPQQLNQLRQAETAEAAAAKAVKDGEFLIARTEASSAITIRERILGDLSPDLIEPLRLLGYAQTELQALDDAEAQLSRALEICEQSYGKNHPRTAAVLDRQGWLYIYRGKPDEAETALRRAVYILTSNLGEAAEAAESMDNLGTALGYKTSADFLEAVNTKLRALVIREKVLGLKSKDTAISLSNLAWLYSRAGLQEEVIPMRKRALETLREALGPDHRDTLVEMSNLAQAYRQNDQPDEAAKLYRELVAHDEKENNPADAIAVSHLTMLGSVLLESGEQAEGEKVMQKAFERMIKLHAQGEHGAAIYQANQLALAYQTRRMLEDACRVRKQAFEWDSRRPGRVTQNSLRAKVQLGLLLAEVGQLKESRDILTKAVEEADIVYGKGERDTTVSMIALASTLEKMNELSEAAKICSEVLRITETKYPDGTLPHAYALMALGRVQLSQKNLDLAKFSLEEALLIMDNASKKDPVRNIGLLQDLAECLGAMGDREGQIEKLRLALAMSDAMDALYPLQHKGLRAGTLNRLRKALAESGSSELEKVTEELKRLITELRDASALSHDDRQCLKELGLSESRG